MLHRIPIIQYKIFNSSEHQIVRQATDRAADDSPNGLGPIRGAGRLLDPEIVNALKSLDGNSTTDFTNRIKFIDDLLATTNPSSNGIGCKVGELTPKTILAWDGLLDAPDYIRRSNINLDQAEKLLALSFTKADLKVLSGVLRKCKEKGVVEADIAKIAINSLKARQFSNQFAHYGIETDIFKQFDLLVSNPNYLNIDKLEYFSNRLFAALNTPTPANPGNPGHLGVLNEAVSLLNKGDKIHLESVTGDILNVTKSESIQFKAYAGAGEKTTTDNLTKAVKQLFEKEAPHTNYNKIVQMKIMGSQSVPPNPQFNNVAEELRTKLNSIITAPTQTQVFRDRCRAITEFRIENGTGFHKFKVNSNFEFEIIF